MDQILNPVFHNFRQPLGLHACMHVYIYIYIEREHEHVFVHRNCICFLKEFDPNK